MATYTTSYKANFTFNRPVSKVRKYSLVDIGDGFETKIYDSSSILEKYELLGNNLVSFLNNICILVETKKTEIPDADWNELRLALNFLMVRYDGGSLYYHILDTYGIESLNYYAWVHFAEDSDWRVCANTFGHMPTKVLERYTSERWENRSATAGEEGRKTILEIIRNRADLYGSQALSTSQVEAVLFNPKQFALADLGSGFQTKIRDIGVWEKYNLLDKGILTSVNELCILVDTKKSEIPSNDWDELHLALEILLARYETGELYDYLLENYGAESLNYQAWVRFASGGDWLASVKTFTDMPTDILETYAVNEGSDSLPWEQSPQMTDMLTALGKRNDIYGNSSLPPEMVVGILFKD